MLRRVLIQLVVLAGACGGEHGGADASDPTDPRFATALVVVLNPAINDANRGAVPVPGAVRAGVTVLSDDGPGQITGNDGIAVLFPLSSGIRTVQLSGNGIAASFSVPMGPGTIREVAIAGDGGRADIMVDVSYTSDTFIELGPTTPAAEINEALRVDDRLVFLRAGAFTGDLEISGSRVTLFGDGILGDTVTVQGNATISGSGSRIRGLHVTGNLSIPVNDAGVSFSRVDGTMTAGGSNLTVLANALCGGAAITGFSSYFVGNRGIAPATACP